MPKPHEIDNPSRTLTQGRTPYKVIEQFNTIHYFDNQRFSTLEIALNYAHNFGYEVVGTTADGRVIMKLKD